MRNENMPEKKDFSDIIKNPQTITPINVDGISTDIDDIDLESTSGGEDLQKYLHQEKQPKLQSSDSDSL